jgi:hypothetical protein
MITWFIRVEKLARSRENTDSDGITDPAPYTQGNVNPSCPQNKGVKATHDGEGK